MGMLPARCRVRLRCCRERIISFSVHCPRNIHGNKKVPGRFRAFFCSGCVDLWIPLLTTKGETTALALRAKRGRVGVMQQFRFFLGPCPLLGPCEGRGCVAIPEKGALLFLTEGVTPLPFNHSTRLGFFVGPVKGTKSELATLPLPSRVPKRGRNGCMAHALLGVSVFTQEENFVGPNCIGYGIKRNLFQRQKPQAIKWDKKVVRGGAKGM